MQKPILKLIVLCFITILISIVSSCGPSQKEYDALKKENEALETEVKKLKKEIDDLIFGASRLLTKGNNYYENGKLNDAKIAFQTLLNKHPESTEAKQAKNNITKINTELKRLKEIEEAKRRKEERDKKIRLANATRKMRKKVDELEKITWYYDKSTPDFYVSGLYFYISKVSTYKPRIRLKVQYRGDNWLFINNFVIYIDGDEYDRYNVNLERDARGGKVREWFDKEASENDMAMARLIVVSDKATIRFNGERYYRDHVITKQEKRALQNVMDAYEALKESDK